MSEIPAWFTKWLRGDDTGTSAETIGFVLVDARALLRRADAPYDTADVGRCVRLLDEAAANGCDWRARMPALAVVHAWRPLVQRWADIEAAYREDVVAQNVAKQAASLTKAGKPRKRHLGRNDWKCPPSRCWWLVSTLRGHGDPYKDAIPHPFAVKP